MPLPIAAIVGMAVASAGAQAFGSQKAAGQQEQAADDARRATLMQYGLTRSDLSPWMDTGEDAMLMLNYLLGIGPTDPTQAALELELNQAQEELDAVNRSGTMNPSTIALALQRREKAKNALRKYEAGGAGEAGFMAPDEYGSLLRPFGLDDFETSPGYQFRMEEGIKGVQSSGAARGMGLSGPTLKAMQRYGQGLASEEYGQAWQRNALEKARTYDYLNALSRQGLTAAGTLGGLGAESAARAGEFGVQSGNAQAAGTMGATNAISRGFDQASQALMLREALRSNA